MTNVQIICVLFQSWYCDVIFFKLVFVPLEFPISDKLLQNRYQSPLSYCIYFTLASFTSVTCSILANFATDAVTVSSAIRKQSSTNMKYS